MPQLFSRLLFLLKELLNASCDKILQCDCTTLYSAAGHSLYTKFARPFPSLVEVGRACETRKGGVFLSLPTGREKFLCFKFQVRIFQSLFEVDRGFVFRELFVSCDIITPLRPQFVDYQCLVDSLHGFSVIEFISIIAHISDIEQTSDKHHEHSDEHNTNITLTNASVCEKHPKNPSTMAMMIILPSRLSIAFVLTE